MSIFRKHALKYPPLPRPDGPRPVRLARPDGGAAAPCGRAAGNGRSGGGGDERQRGGGQELRDGRRRTSPGPGGPGGGRVGRGSERPDRPATASSPPCQLHAARRGYRACGERGGHPLLLDGTAPRGRPSARVPRPRGRELRVAGHPRGRGGGRGSGRRGGGGGGRGCLGASAP